MPFVSRIKERNVKEEITCKSSTTTMAETTTTTTSEEDIEMTDSNGGDDDVIIIRDLLSFARHLILLNKPSQALQAVVMAMRAKGGEEAVLYTLGRARELYRSKLQASSQADQLASLFAECVISEAQPPTTADGPHPQPPSLSQSPVQLMTTNGPHPQPSLLQLPVQLTTLNGPHAQPSSLSQSAVQLTTANGPHAQPPSLPRSGSAVQLTTDSLDAVESDAHGRSILSETGRRQLVFDAFSDGSSFICLQCGGLVSKVRKDEHYAYWCQF